jgi:hypothetical protein
VLFALETLELNGIEAAFADRRRQTDETARQRAAQMSALERRATMLEAAISEARTSEARARLVVRFDEILTALQAARVEGTQAPEPVELGVTPELLARLEPLKVPSQAWERFSMRTRKDVLQALTGRIWIYPEVAGYVVAIDWRDGGRAAARVRTARRRKQFLVPDDVLALFDGMEQEVDGAAMGSIAACSWTNRLPTVRRPDGPPAQTTIGRTPNRHSTRASRRLAAQIKASDRAAPCRCRPSRTAPSCACA